MGTNDTGENVVTPFWERAWLDSYPHDVPSSLSYPNVPLSQLLENAAQRFPHRTACKLFSETLTYAEVVEQSQRLAHSLQQLGAGPGKRVAMLLPNIPEYLIALQATWLTGATALQLSPLMVPEELEKWLEKTNCHIAVTLDLLAPGLSPCLDNDSPLEHLIITSLAQRMSSIRGWLYRVERVRRKGPLRLTENGNIHQFPSLLRPVQKRIVPVINPAEDVALLVPTGGTTASPKAVMLTHRNLVANALQLRHWSRTEDGSAGVLAVLPLFHAYGLSVCVLSSIAMGATIYMHSRFEVESVLDLLEKEQIHLVPAVPAMLNALNRGMRRHSRNLSRIRAVISGASALSSAIRQEFESHGARNVVEGYGLSEASPVTHCNPLDGGSRPGTIGLPLPDTEAKIMDEATGKEELPIGAVGELVIRGPQVMKGYLDNPEESAIALRDGWLYTGDIARRDRDGFFTIVDRKKDIIKTSGFLVFPAEVEEILNQFPGIAEAAVVGEPHAEKGEIIAAYVVPKNGGLDLHALEQHCQNHLSKQKRPKAIRVVKELPKNFLGKIQRRKIRERQTPDSGIAKADAEESA